MFAKYTWSAAKEDFATFLCTPLRTGISAEARYSQLLERLTSLQLHALLYFRGEPAALRFTHQVQTIKEWRLGEEEVLQRVLILLQE